MRRIIQVTALAMMLGGSALPALAQGPFAPVIYVNDSAVTAFEVDQRTRFIQLLNGPDSDRESVLRELVNDRLKMQAARQIGVEITDEALAQGASEFAGRANMGTEQFIAALAQAGVEEQSFIDFVRAGIAWREVVRARIVPQVNITDREIEQAQTRAVQTPIVTQVLLSELVIPAPPGSEERALAQAEEVARTVGSEAEFAAAARRLSATPSAPSGGRIDWLAVGNLPPSLRQVVLQLRPGTTSAPLTVPGAVVMFFLRDTRGTLRAGATDQTVDYLTMDLPTVADGARILAVAQSCTDARAEANRFTPDPARRETAPLGAVPADVAQRLASLDDNEGTVIDYGSGARLVMLCKRTVTALAEPEPAWITPPGVAATATRDNSPAPAAGAPRRATGLSPATGAPIADQPSAGVPAEVDAAADAPAPSQPAPPQSATSEPAPAEAEAEGEAPADAVAPEQTPVASREDIRAEIFNDKINAAADAYLAELRADAMVRQP